MVNSHGIPADFPFGPNVRKKRIDLGINQKDLAKKIARIMGQHLSASYLSMIEKSQRNPPLTVASAIARSLGVKLDELLKK